MTRPPRLTGGTRPDARYWNEVANHSPAGGKLWRRHADAINAGLIARWWPDRPVRRALKTDVFDEICGQGLLPDLASRSRCAFGLDEAIAAVRQARHTQPTSPLVAADVRALPYASASFDVVVSNSTLDHFENPDDIAVALAEIYRVLAPGGRLILTLDNPVNPLVALRNALPFRLLRGTGLVPYFVGATYGPRAGRKALSVAGFTVRDTTAVMHCPRVWAVRRAARLDRAPLPHAGRSMKFLDRLEAWERLARWPSRYLTGHFIAWMADRPD